MIFPNFSFLFLQSNGIDELTCEGEQDEEEIGPILLQDLDPNVDLKKSVDLISMQEMEDFCSSLENISSKYSSTILMTDQETNSAKEEEDEGEEREDDGEHDQMAFKLKLKQKDPAFTHDFSCGKSEDDDHDGLLSSGNHGHGRLIMKNTQTDHEGEGEEEEEEEENME